MRFKWEVDETTIVEANSTVLGKEVVSVNGTPVASKRNWYQMTSVLPFVLEDGRKGTVTLKVHVFGMPEAELRIDGALVAESSNESITCGRCGAVARSFDRFCDDCGKPLDSPMKRASQKQLKQATSVMLTLAVLFAIAGVAMFFVARSQADEALGHLARLDDAAPLTLEGATRTVAEWRDQVVWEPWGVLATKFVLAGTMLILALWGKRAPLPALVVATATYATVIVVNAIVDPRTLGQGLWMKFIVIGLLWRGINAGIALRASQETDATAIASTPSV